jgi:hypothetical protein
VSSLVAACIPGNTDKDARPIAEFLAANLALLAHIEAQASAPLKDALLPPLGPLCLGVRRAVNPKLGASIAMAGGSCSVGCKMCRPGRTDDMMRPSCSPITALQQCPSWQVGLGSNRVKIAQNIWFNLSGISQVR